MVGKLWIIWIQTELRIFYPVIFGIDMSRFHPFIANFSNQSKWTVKDRSTMQVCEILLFGLECVVIPYPKQLGKLVLRLVIWLPVSSCESLSYRLKLEYTLLWKTKINQKHLQFSLGKRISVQSIFLEGGTLFSPILTSLLILLVFGPHILNLLARFVSPRVQVTTSRWLLRLHTNLGTNQRPLRPWT